MTIHRTSTSSSSIYKRMFRRLYIQYAMIFCGLFLCAVLLFGYQIRRQNQENATIAASSLSNYAASLLQECQKLAVNIGRSEQLLNLASVGTAELNFSELDSTTFFAAQHSLVSYKAFNRYISTLDVYLYNREYIISDFGTITLESFCQSVFGAGAQECAAYLSPLASGSSYFLCRGTANQADLPTSHMYALSLINSNGTRYGNLFILLDEKQMAEDAAVLLNDNIEYCIFDQLGNLVLSNCDPANAITITYEGIRADKTFLSTRDGSSGWYCFAGYSDAYLQRQWLFLALFSVVILLVILLALIPLTHAVCRHNYAPIREIANIISPGDSRKVEQELEYEALMQAVNAVFENKALLEDQIFMYRPLLINSLLLQILNDAAADHRTALAGLENLGISFYHPVFLCVCYIAPHLEMDFPSHTAKALRSDTTTCYYLTCRDHVAAFCLNSADTADSEQALEMLCQILDQEHTILSYGSGVPGQGLSHAAVSFSQALCALEYLPCDPPEKSVDYDTLLQNGDLEHQRPGLLRSLGVVLSAGRFSDAAGSLEQYFADICATGYAKKSDLCYARDQLLSALDKFCRERDLSLDTSALAACNPMCAADAVALQHACLDACNQAQTLSQQQEQTQSAIASQQLLSYLEAHLCDEDLSLSSMADAFRASESSISRRIKQLTGTTFLSYVTQHRIERSCELLRTTDLPINDIAKACGYENDITFRRLFKKHTGMTPGDYRKQRPDP